MPFNKNFYVTIFFLSSVLFLIFIPDGLSSQNLTDYVDPFIGTSNKANTFPGAVAPWGMASVSPHNKPHSPSGYVDGNDSIFGFGHVHLSGTGCPGLGNIVAMPTSGGLNFNIHESKSTYSNQQARPGYYEVHLSRYDITCQMSATARSGISRFTFGNSEESANIIIDVSDGLSRNKGGFVNVISDTEIEGYANSGGFCWTDTDSKVYFYAIFSQPADSIVLFKDYSSIQSGNASSDFVGLGAAAIFSEPDNQSILLRVGISYVSSENARLNLKAEQQEQQQYQSFEQIKDSADSLWETALSKIRIRGGSPDRRAIFYTALYHSLIHPNIVSDVNGQYPLMDSDETGIADGYMRYTVFSLWDTYRTLHPLLCLVYPQQQLDMVKSMVGMYEENGWLPKWEIAGNETFIMDGDPALPVITDTYLKGIRNFDIDAAYRAMLKHATFLDSAGQNPIRNGMYPYLEYGYIPEDFEDEKILGTVSTSLEYYFSDWALARLAEELGKTEDHDKFLARSHNYRHLFNSETGFLRARYMDGSWLSPFDPYEVTWTSGGYREGNAFNYQFFVPHDIAGVIDLFGGSEAFYEALSFLFDADQFVMWNEPDMAFPYLFNYLPGKSHQTQKYARLSLNKFFKTGPAGLPGNDDAGTLSAWYVFSAMGIYPDCPGSNFYQIGSPVFDEVSIELDTNFYPGKEFIIRTENNSEQNMYISDATLNGYEYYERFISHTDIVNGGILAFRMTNEDITGYEFNSNNSTGLQLRAYPNPFAESTNIHFNLEKPSVVSLSVFSILGNETAVVNNQYINQGSHWITVDSEGFSEGVLFFRLIVNNKIHAGKFILHR